MPSVIAVRIAFSVVDQSVGEDSVTFGQSVAQPPRCLSNRFLDEDLYAVRPSVTHHDIVLPGLRACHEGDSVLVLKHIVHVLPVALDGKLPTRQAVVVQPQ